MAAGALGWPDVGVALAEALGVGEGVAEGRGVGVADGAVVGVGAGEGGGVLPELVLGGNAVRRWLVPAWMAVKAAMAMTKISTHKPATATHRRRIVGSPARRLLHRSRLQPEGAASSGSVRAGPVGPASRIGVGRGRPGRVASALDQSVRRAATATRRSRSFVRRSDAR